MHKIKIVGVKTLESGKFNGDTGEMENPCKGTIKWDKSVPLTEAGAYNNTESIIMTEAEYEALTGGHNIAVPYKFIEGLKTIRSVIDDAIAEAEGE